MKIWALACSTKATIVHNSAAAWNNFDISRQRSRSVMHVWRSDHILWRFVDGVTIVALLDE